MTRRPPVPLITAAVALGLAGPAAAANSPAWHPATAPALPSGVAPGGGVQGEFAAHATGPGGSGIVLFQWQPGAGASQPASGLWAVTRTSGTGGWGGVRRWLGVFSNLPVGVGIGQGSAVTALRVDSVNATRPVLVAQGTLSGGKTLPGQASASPLRNLQVWASPTTGGVSYSGIGSQVSQNGVLVDPVLAGGVVPTPASAPVQAGVTPDVDDEGAAVFGADALGNQTAVWQAPDGSIQLATLASGSQAWAVQPPLAGPLALSPPAGNPSGPALPPRATLALSVAPNGNKLLAVVIGTTLSVAQRPAGGDFGPLTPVATLTPPAQVAVATNASGAQVLAWTQPTGVSVTRTQAGAPFPQPTVFPTVTGVNTVAVDVPLSVAVDPNGLAAVRMTGLSAIRNDAGLSWSSPTVSWRAPVAMTGGTCTTGPNAAVSGTPLGLQPIPTGGVQAAWLCPVVPPAKPKTAPVGVRVLDTNGPPIVAFSLKGDTRATVTAGEAASYRLTIDPVRGGNTVRTGRLKAGTATTISFPAQDGRFKATLVLTATSGGNTTTAVRTGS